MGTQFSLQQIQTSIIRLPNRPPVMLASALASFYETETKRLNEAVKRNPERFPEPEFCFHLADSEWENLKSQNAASSHGGVRHAPLAFTRMGANMLSAVLKTPVAAARSVQIMRAFSLLEEGRIAPAPVSAPETVTMTKDEYIDLLKAQIALHELQPRRRVLEDGEKAEILALHHQGWTSSAIGKRLDRPSGSIDGFLRRVRLGMEG